MIKPVEKFGKVSIAKLINRFEKKTFIALDIPLGWDGWGGCCQRFSLFAFLSD